MGQFASRAFDGDPYIDIMRALPDKELVWWVQKVIWLAEGFTILEHFGRTYPDIFMHKCLHCNGAGTVTCPHCHGYKVKRAHAHSISLPQNTKVGRLLTASDLQECTHCGNYCPWDNESDWQEDWNTWQRRLSYYDRTHGDLFNEWYEDVINEGRLDEDTAPEDEPVPPESDQTLSANVSREVFKDKKRLKALMRRLGGHPYEHSHLLPYPVVDPYRPLSENLENMGYNKFDLPPELHPEKFPELLIQGPNGPLQQFDREIQAEYLIMNNLDAALRDAPKPAMFHPSAGTVACPACHGQAWTYEWVPNIQKLLKAEQPFWARTFSRMSPYWHSYSATDSSPTYSPWRALSGAAPGSETRQAGGQRLLGEIPTQPPLMSDKQVAAVEEALKPGPLPQFDEELVLRAGARRLDGGVDYGRLWAYVTSTRESAPSYLSKYGTQMMPNNEDMRAVAQELFHTDAGKPTPSYGANDPLSANAQQSLDPQSLQRELFQGGKGPLLKDSVLDARLQVVDLANPARAAARQLRDARQLGKAEAPEEQELLLKWAQQQPSLRGG